MNWHEEQRRISMARTRIAKTILAALLFLLLFVEAHAQTDPLPSWNDGAPKKAIIEFVQVTAEKGSVKFVAPEARRIRSGRNDVGRAADVHAGGLLPGASSGGGAEKAGSQKRRTVQDRAVRQPRG